jgi:hypothetical protein
MKPILIILPIVAVTAFIGRTRQTDLDRLNRENARLEKSTPVSQTRSQRNERPPALSQAEAAEIQSLASQVVTHIANAANPTTDLAARQATYKTFQEKLAKLDHQAIHRLIEESINGMTDEQKAALYQVYAQTLATINPEQAVQLLVILPPYKEKDQALMFAFRQTASKNPSLAVRSFEQMEAAGDPAIRHIQILKYAFAAQARLDPEVAVARLLSSRGAELVPDLKDLPQSIAGELRDPPEHHAFLVALRTEGLKFPNSVRLERLRGGYVSSLQERMAGWPLNDAMPLVEAEFTPKEKLSYVRTLGDNQPYKPELWADWVSKMEWEDKLNHPIRNYIRVWAGYDAPAARKWLEGLPEDKIRNEALENYALDRSHKFPEDATEVAMMLPPGKKRDRVLKVIARPR